MPTNNPIDSLNPIQTSVGGQGNSSLTPYGILYGNGTSPAGSTSAGSAGQILISNGGISAPSWSSNGGQLVNIQRQRSSVSATSVNFTTGINSTYNTYLIFYDYSTTISPGVQLGIRLSNNAGSSWISTGYTGGSTWYSPDSGFTNTNSTTCFPLVLGGANISKHVIWLYGMTDGSNPMMTSYGWYFPVAPSLNDRIGNSTGSLNTGNINGIQFFYTDGSSLPSYDITLYGLAE